MITRLVSDRRRLAVLRRIDRPAAVGLAVAQAITAAVGWFVDPVWLAVTVAVQLALGGVGAVRVIGAGPAELGFARYAMPAAAGIAATLVGRLLPGGLSLLLVPIVAVLLWSVWYLELRLARGSGGLTIGGLLHTVIIFSAGAGLLDLFGARAWPTPLILVAVFALPVALRSAEARGAVGAEGVGQALLHLLVVAQVGAGALLLDLPITILAALMALAFYAWAGAVDALRGNGSGRSVAVEYGAFVLLGLVVALLLHRP